jgi:hypothetical protein
MWVMLLWALTLPGHEVIVYDFLLKVISGEPVAKLAEARQEISSATEKHNTCHVFKDAAPASFSGKFQSPDLYFAPRTLLFALYQSGQVLIAASSFLRNVTVQQFLQFSVLPNAP